MSPTEQKKLGAFLESRGKKDVRSYLKIGPQSSPDELSEAVEKRRLWAQAQQTNPKFQEEALWVLAHTHLLQEALEKSAEELLWLKPSTKEAGNTEKATDHYALLGVSRDATADQIQDAHRLRYRDARQLKNRHEAHQVYAELDEAWRVLSDPKLRAEYDAQHGPSLRLGSDPSGETPESPARFSERDALTHSPNLAFTGPSQLQFVLSGKPVHHTLRVERIGPGLVDATIRSDQDWLKVSPERLDPHASSQKLTLTLVPEKVPGRGALGQLVLKNFNGQRLALHVRVRSTPETHVRRGFLVGVLGIAALAGGGWLMASNLFSTAPAQPVLHLTVEPAHAEAWINNELKGSDWPGRIDQLPVDSPFRLRLEAPGHHKHQETLVLSIGQELRKDIRLQPLSERPVNPGTDERGETP